MTNPTTQIDPQDQITEADLATMTTEELDALSHELGLQIAGDKEIAEKFAADMLEVEAIHDAALETAEVALNDISAQMHAGIDQHNLDATRATLQP